METTQTPNPTTAIDQQIDPKAPYDADHSAMKRIGEPYKCVDGTWSDGGTDTHLTNGQFRKDWTNSMKSSQNRRWLLQMALTRCCNVVDVIQIMTAMMDKARAGDRHCAELVLKYVVGDPVTLELMQRLHQLEQQAGIKGGGVTTDKADQEAIEITKTLRLAESAIA